MDCRLVILVLCVGIRAPSSDALQVTTTSVGKDVTLRCQISNLDSDLRFLYWRKDGNTIYSRIGNGENAVGKYSVIDSTSLLIPDVEDNDAGNFSCKVVRQSLTTEESDMIQLLVLDLSVSNCKDTRQDVDGCSCYINGANITSLECSATGFPHFPVITWDESEITYRSSSVDLTRYNKNLTVVCKAHDRNLQSVVANKTVCVHYTRGVKPNGPTGETPVPPVRNEALVAAIILGTLLAFVCLALPILWLIYRHKMGKDLCLRTRFFWTSSPKTSREPPKSKLRGMNSSGYGSEMVDVFKDSFKHSEASSAPDVSKLDGIEAVDIVHVDYFTKDCNEDPKTSREPSKRTLRGMNSSGYCSETVDVFKDSFKISEASSVPDIRTVDLDHVHYFPKDCNEDFMVDDEPPLPLVGQVLLDDLKSSTEEDKESMKAAILALLEKRIEPYKMNQSHVEPYVTVKASSSDLNETLQRSMMIDKFSDPDASFVYMVLQDLDQILDERDRDECEILITKPGFQEVTDESEIPAYQGDRVLIHQSLRMHQQDQSKTPHMTGSMVARIPLSSVLRKELLKKPSERSTIRNAISQIILDFMKKGHSGLRTSNNLKYSASTPMDTNVDGEVFRLVAFWTSKIVKLDNDVNNHIRKYLFPLKPRITNKCPDADPQIARLQEEEEQEEIPETPSSAKLLEESIQR